MPGDYYERKRIIVLPARMYTFRDKTVDLNQIRTTYASEDSNVKLRTREMLADF